MEEKIYSSQINSLIEAKKYLKYCKKKSIDVGLSPYCDFVTWADCVGNEKIKLLAKGKFLSFGIIKNFLKEVFFISKNYKYLKKSSKLEKEKKFNIIYSYCSKKNFSKNGIFFDQYFNFSSSQNKNTYWFLISLDNYVPKKTNNIFIIYKKKQLFNFFYLIYFFFLSIFKKNFLHYFNNTNNFSIIISNFFYETFKGCKFDLYMPYENRPHQNSIINTTRVISKTNRIFCYFHRSPEPLQIEMIYKSKSITKLYVCSNLQKKILNKYLSWPKKKIYVINSLRYLKFKKRKNFIFIPYKINKKNYLIDRLVYLLSKKNASLKKFKVSLHYLNKKSMVHLDFKNQIENIINNNKNLDTPTLDAPVILGEPGGVASEMLDTIGKVYHICENPLDIFSTKIWNSIKVIKLSESIYIYSKTQNKKLVNVNGNINNFKKLLNSNKKF